MVGTSGTSRVGGTSKHNFPEKSGVLLIGIALYVGVLADRKRAAMVDTRLLNTAALAQANLLYSGSFLVQGHLKIMRCSAFRAVELPHAIRLQKFLQQVPF